MIASYISNFLFVIILAVVSLMGISSYHAWLTPLATMLPALFAKLSTVYNPLIYAVSHPRYRQVSHHSMNNMNKKVENLTEQN